MPDNSTRVPTVSVLMPCFNAAQTLDETMQSLLEQTYPDFEIVAVDDGSTDQTPDRLEMWAHKESRLRIAHIPHAGIIPALNHGLDLCRAPLIARMDADDVAHPDRLLRQVELLEHRSEIAAVGSLVEGFPAETLREGYKIYIDWLNRLVDPDAIAREIFIESPLPHPSVMVRKSWFNKVGGYEERGWAEDYDLWLRMHTAGAQFAKVPEILLYWREYADRLTRTDSRYSVENFLRAKSYYLAVGPLKNSAGVVIWGAGQMGRRISKHIERNGVRLKAFIDIDPKKIGRTMRGCPIVARDQLMSFVRDEEPTYVLAAVGSRGARGAIREYLSSIGLREGLDWWAVA